MYASRFVFISIAFALNLTSPVNALDLPSIAAVAANPKAYVGKLIGFRGASCVDHANGFLCVASDKRRSIHVEASALGPSGGAEVGERLIGPCKGKNRLGRSTCKFNLMCTPTSAIKELDMIEFEGIKATKLVCGVIEISTID